MICWTLHRETFNPDMRALTRTLPSPQTDRWGMQQQYSGESLWIRSFSGSFVCAYRSRWTSHAATSTTSYCRPPMVTSSSGVFWKPGWCPILTWSTGRVSLSCQPDISSVCVTYCFGILFFSLTSGKRDRTLGGAHATSHLCHLLSGLDSLCAPFLYLNFNNEGEESLFYPLK